MRRAEQQGLKASLRDPSGVGVFWFATGVPTLVDIALTAGPQAVVVDLQHGLWDRRTLEQVIGDIGNRVPLIARLSTGSATMIGEALDAGAEGVLIPLVESAAQAAACVEAAHYPPHGCRSGGGIRPVINGFAPYVAASRSRTTVGVMIETAEGLAQVEAIAATPGLDFVFIGTTDLALSLDCFPNIDARHAEACRRILRACQAADVPCGLFTTSPEEAARRIAEGYRLVVVANDIALLSAGFRNAQSVYTAGAPKSSTAEANTTESRS
jgi:2-keto-3-deoxy-L-rhamnonate aldolase RhmA